MPCAACLSRERETSVATAQAVKTACARAGGRVELVLLFATASHIDVPEVARAAREAAGGAHVLGAVSSGLVGEDAEIEDGPGIVALALGPDTPAAQPFWIGGSLPAWGGAPPGAALFFSDGSSGPPDGRLGDLQAVLPAGTPIAGAVAVAGGPGAPLPRFIDETIAMSRPAGLLLGRPGEVAVGLAQGCQPIGPRLTVTASRGNVVETLDGGPAFEAFAERARPLLHDLPRAAQTIFLAIDEEPDWVVRGIVAFDPEKGLLAASAPVPVGTRLRFAIRDGATARDSLRAMLEDVRHRLGRAPSLALWFGSAGRGRSLFNVPGHDVAFLRDALGPLPLVGLIGGSEIAPSLPGGRARLHIFSGVLVLA
jgi:small ligand-binding sensory domain FIST